MAATSSFELELLRSRDPVQAEVVANWLGELHTRFAERIVPMDAAVEEEWGRLNAAAPRNTVDSLIAASARVRGLTVVTGNTGDFEDCGVALINPWQPEAAAPTDLSSFACDRTPIPSSTETPSASGGVAGVPGDASGAGVEGGWACSLLERDT